MKLTVAFLTLFAIVGVVVAENAVNINDGSYSPELGDYPFTVRLRIALNNGNMLVCGGALIDPRWTITAARCIQDRASGTVATFIWQKFGLVSSSSPSLILESGIFSTILHPQFDGIFNDVALILTEYIHPTANCHPIRYQKETVNFPVGEPFKTCFWGLNNDRTAPSQELRCAGMSSVQFTQCAIPPFPFPNIICALGPANCDSDRGSPLTVQEEDGTTLVGILYYGPPGSCASVEMDQSVAIAYTRVSLYADWISRMIELIGS